MKTASANILGDTIRSLLAKRQMKACELAKKIEISATSISKIMNGVSRPRQNSFTRMCEVLCETKEEERRLVSAFAGTELLDEEKEKPTDDAMEREILRLRAEQFLERKTQSIQFKRSVARELDKAGITYQQDYCEVPYPTDFLIEKDGKRIAQECKSNVGRDYEKTVAQAELICEKFQCQTCVVVPYIDDLTQPTIIEGVKCLPLSEVRKHLFIAT